LDCEVSGRLRGGSRGQLGVAGEFKGSCTEKQDVQGAGAGACGGAEVAGCPESITLTDACQVDNGGRRARR